MTLWSVNDLLNYAAIIWVIVMAPWPFWCVWIFSQVCWASNNYTWKYDSSFRKSSTSNTWVDSWKCFFLPETKMSLTKNIYSIYSFHGRVVIHESVDRKNLSKAGFVSPLLALRQCRDWGAAISLIDQPLKRLRLIQSIRQITSTIKHRTDSVQNWQLWKISLKTVQEIYWERKREILTPPSAHPAYGFGSLISG